MKNTVLQQHLNSLVANISSISKLIEQLTFEEFSKEEHVKETAYSYLQEIGQIANEITRSSDETDFDVKSLAALSNARYNQESEMAHRAVWSIIKNDLSKISDEIEHSTYYNNVESETF